MHVLSIIHYPVFGGPHNRNLRIVPVLEKKGVQTTVLLPDEPGNAAERLRSAGVDVVQLPLHRLRATLNVRTQFQFLSGLSGELNAIRELIDRLGIDVVQINGLVNPHGALAASRAGIPVVWQILDTFTPIPLRYLLSPILVRFSDVVMCTGDRVAREHPGAMKRPDRLVNFYPPVDIECFTDSQEVRSTVRSELNVTDASIVIGTVGNINHQKGHDNFIRAAALVKAKVPSAKFLIFGAEHDNHRNYIEGLHRLAKKADMQLGRDLIIMDPTGRVHELLQAMDVFWMTPRPRSEGIPTAMEEAMAMSLPVVSFDVGSINELVEDGVTGYLVCKQEPQVIANRTLEHLLDVNQRTTMGKQGRARVEKYATLEVCANKHVTAYNLAVQSNSYRLGTLR